MVIFPKTFRVLLDNFIVLLLLEIVLETLFCGASSKFYMEIITTLLLLLFKGAYHDRMRGFSRTDVSS